VQNQLAWMAGTISRKFRGLRAKNRTWLELFLNAQGLRVYLKETQGLFSKTTRPKGYARFSAVGSRSDGLDLNGLGSNRGR